MQNFHINLKFFSARNLKQTKSETNKTNYLYSIGDYIVIS